MSTINLKATNERMSKKINEILDTTLIIKRQLELDPDEWNFVIYGPRDNQTTVIREGYARHLHTNHSSLYLAAFCLTGEISPLGCTGVPIEEFTNDDIPEDLTGLELYHVEPLRPVTLTLKKDGPPKKIAKKIVLNDYEERNIAIIETPDEAYWGISLLKYFNECNEYFPDPLTDALRKSGLPINTRMLHLHHSLFKSGLHGSNLN